MYSTFNRTRKGFWFGTEQRMQWFQTPLAGADTSPTGWNASGTTLNGGGFELNSFGSHKVYRYEWSGNSARETAQLMKSYADGSYGRGLIYFIDPLTYSTNVLPARLADPSMALGYEGGSLVYGLQPTGTPVALNQNNLPVSSASYNMATTAVGFRGKQDAVFVPIPEGYTLVLGAMYTFTESGGVFASPQNTSGTVLAAQKLTALAASSANVVVDKFSNVSGVWLWVGKSAAGAATVNLNAMVGRLIETDQVTNNTPTYQELLRGPWIGGQGHSGCRFSGKPTYIEYGGVNDGQIGFAATFREVGSWAFG